MNISMDSMKHSLWHKITSYFLTIFMTMQFTLPSVAVAMTSISNEQLNQELSQEQMFIRSVLTARLYERSKYIPPVPLSYSNQTIAELHSQLKTSYLHRLPSEIVTNWIPIAGDITIFIPSERATYPLGKTVGDTFVQRKLIGNQIKRLIGRTYYQPGFSSEQAQIQQLYSNALTVAGKSAFTYQFGNQLPEGIADTIKADFIWPENRNIGGEYVLTPVVHLQTNTVEAKGIDGTHTVEFRKSNATFKSAKISNADLKLQNDTVFRTINDLVIGTKSSISIDASAARIYAGVSFIDNGYGSVQGIATGTLYNYGQINAERNVDIVAGNYQQKTFVHRFKTPHGYQDRLGSIASINAGGGISIRTYNNMLFEAAEVTASGGSINLYANGNINIGAVSLENASNFKMRGGKRNQQGVNYVQSILSAQDNISLYAAGLIEIIASELHADKGVISILADNGIYILNEFDESSSNMDRKWRNTTETEQEFETIAIRSVLEAGKGVIIASDYGDITLKATHISSGEGTEISARNGRVNLLLAKEQDHYYYNKVKKGFWKIKTETIQDTTDTAVYNQIIGGVKVTATHGLTLELGKYDGESVTDVIGNFSNSGSLSWMADIYNDSKYACPPPSLPPHEDFYSRTVYQAIQQDADFNSCSSMLDVIYNKLEDIHIHEKTSNLSPAAMAIIAIAMSVAMGPAGPGWIGSGANAIGPALNGAISGAAMQAGAVTLATSAASSLANGEGIDGAIKKIISSDGLRSLAISMATAGVLNSEAFNSLGFVNNADFASSFFTNELAIDIATQATQALVTSTVRAGISTIINGGDIGDFGQAFKVNLVQNAINSLSVSLAQEIGDADLDVGILYASHAAVGCITGTLTTKLSGGDSNLGCVSGAGGAVIGEYIGRSYQDNLKENVSNWLAEQKILGNELNKDDIQRQVYAFKQAGVDLARLGAALTALTLGGNVDIAGNSGANAAENNALFTITAIVLAAAYTSWVSYQEGGLYEGLQAIGRGEHPIADALNYAGEIADEYIEVLSDEFPEEALQIQRILVGVNETITEGVMLVVETGVLESGAVQKVVMYWNDIPLDKRQGLIGAGKVIGVMIPAGVITKLKILNNSGLDNTNIDWNKDKNNKNWDLLSSSERETLEPTNGFKAKNKEWGIYSTYIDDEVTVIENKSLPDSLIITFLDSKYRTVITEVDITVYRVYGGQAELGGGFASTAEAKDRIQAKLDAALLPDWKNTRISEAEILIPAGTELHIGIVAPQTIKSTGTILPGGADQILLPQSWPEEWVQKIVDVKP